MLTALQAGSWFCSVLALCGMADAGTLDTLYQFPGGGEAARNASFTSPARGGTMEEREAMTA